MPTCDACGREAMVVFPYQGRRFKVCGDCKRMIEIMERETECDGTCHRGNS
jgi:hypothetical protein